MFDDPPPPAKKGDFKSLIIVTEFELEGGVGIGVDTPMFSSATFPKVVMFEMEDSVVLGTPRFRVYVNVFALLAIDDEEGVGKVSRYRGE